MKKSIIFLVIILSSQYFFAQDSENDDFKKSKKEIEWSAERKLTWEDFKGKPSNVKNNDAAMTSSEFKVQTRSSSRNNYVEVIVENIFNCTESWVKESKMNVVGLLEHEQAHFDLSEVFARKLRKRIYENNDKTKIKKYIEGAYQGLHKRQRLYDKETNHGIDKVKQAEWLEIISKELHELNEFSK